MKNWPWYGYLILAALVGILVFFFFFKPRNEELAKLKTQRANLEKELQTLRLKKQELDKIEAELVTLKKSLAELSSIIPEKREIDDILRRIQQLAYDNRLNIMRFEPKGEINREFYSEWPINIVTTGNYHNLGFFFNSLSQFARLFTVPSVSIKALGNQTDAATVTASWTAMTYIFLDEAAIPPPAAKKPAPARPKR
jgi:type IV pilus assembly protein PilO